PPPGKEKRWWMGLIADALAAGRRMERVHVVKEPLTEYLRYELEWGYADSVEAGEDIRILPVADDWPDDLPRFAFWLFDSRRSAVMHYDDQRRFLGAELREDPETVAQHCYWRDVAWHYAIPYMKYMTERGLVAGRQAN